MGAECVRLGGRNGGEGGSAQDSVCMHACFCV